MCLLLAVTGTVWADERLQWSFDHVNDVRGVSHMEPGRPANGVLAGQTAWDPIIGLRVPPEGIDAARYTWLTVRLYSSDKADVLDVYYQSPDGNWCLGGKLPIAKGWATYRMDLTKTRGERLEAAMGMRRDNGVVRANESICCASIQGTRRTGGLPWTMCDSSRLDLAWKKVSRRSLEPAGS